MWPLPTNLLLHGFVEGPTGWASATIWNSRVHEHPQAVFEISLASSR